MKTIRTAVLLLASLLAMPALLAQHALIKGRAIGDSKPEGQVTLYRYTDYITENLYERAEVPIQGDTFQILLRYHDATEPFLLHYRNKTMQLFVEPEGTYEVVLGQEGFALAKEPESGLNRKIMDYGNRMFAFMEKAKDGLVDPRAFDDFRTSMFMQYYGEKHPFFNAYYKYDLKVKELFFGATGQYWMNKDDFDKAERNYLTETPIRLRHPKWAEYFRNHVQYRSRFCKLQRIDCCDPAAACQETAPFEEAAHFQNDTLRELATVVMIAHKIGSSKGGERLDILQRMKEKLDSMEQQASTAPAKALATQYKEQFDLFGLGSEMPTIALRNALGELVHVNEASKGKYVLLDFWALWCKPCMKEMQFLSELPGGLPEGLEVVSISVDESPERVWQFVAEKEYGWTFLHNGEDRRLLNQLLINVYPSYFLFDPNGKLLYRPSSLSTEWEKLAEMVGQGQRAE
jgi:thiol-disulfide isomerase/thioredoxin